MALSPGLAKLLSSLLEDWVCLGSFLSAFLFFYTSILTTSSPVVLLILVQCSRHSYPLLVLWAPHHTLVHWFSPSSPILWVGSHIMELDQRQCSMVLDTCHSHNGGVMVSSSQLLIFSSGLGSEASGGRPSACGRVAVFANS